MMNFFYPTVVKMQLWTFLCFAVPTGRAGKSCAGEPGGVLGIQTPHKPVQKYLIYQYLMYQDPACMACNTHPEIIRVLKMLYLNM